MPEKERYRLWEIESSDRVGEKNRYRHSGITNLGNILKKKYYKLNMMSITSLN